MAVRYTRTGAPPTGRYPARAESNGRTPFEIRVGAERQTRRPAGCTCQTKLSTVFATGVPEEFAWDQQVRDQNAGIFATGVTEKTSHYNYRHIKGLSTWTC